MLGEKVLRISRDFRAPVEAVFDAWTSEEVMNRWWRAERDWPDSSASVDLRVGGELRVVMHDPARERSIGGGGVYTEIARPTRLAFTWLWDSDSRRTLIEIDFSEAGGVTTVRFTHSALWDEEAVRAHEGGWSECFDNLGRVLGETTRDRGGSDA